MVSDVMLVSRNLQPSEQTELKPSALLMDSSLSCLFNWVSVLILVFLTMLSVFHLDGFSLFSVLLRLELF